MAAAYVGYSTIDGMGLLIATSVVPPEQLAIGYVIYAWGVFAFHIGLELLRPSAQDNALLGTWQLQAGLLRWLMVLWGLGIIFRMRPSWFSRLGTVANPLAWASTAALSMLLLIPRQYWPVSKNRFRVLVLIGLAGILGSSLVPYGKSSVMLSFIPILWVCWVRKDLQGWIPILVIGLAVLYILVVAPTITVARGQPLQDGETKLEHLRDSFEPLIFLEPQRSLGVMANNLDATFYRQFDPLPTAFIYGEVERDGLQWGKTMSYASYAFVPRFLWPEKPPVSRGGWFTTYLGMAARPEEATTSTGMTTVGELYWNFGTIGVIVGMLAYGIFTGLLWRMAGKYPVARPLHMLLYVIATMAVMDMPEAVSVFAAVLANLLIFGTLFMFLDSHRRKRKSYAIVLAR